MHDTDGDGRFDRSAVFVDKLVWPTGIACFDGGLFIAAAPELLYCKDTTGDGKADLREVVLSRVCPVQPQRAAQQSPLGPRQPDPGHDEYRRWRASGRAVGA